MTAASLAKHFSTKQTPQSEPIPGKPMVANSAGGFSFALDDWERLRRFLILGSDGGTYYTGERELTKENAECVLRCAKADAGRAVKEIVDISDSGRAPKNDPAIFALALIAGLGEPEARKAALEAVNQVCRIGTHILHFDAAVSQFRGRGRQLNRAIANWYLSKEEGALAYQVAKYQQRDGTSHRDLLRQTKVAKNSPLFRWITGRPMEARTVKRFRFDPALPGGKELIREDSYPAAEGALPAIIQAFEEAKKADNVATICRLISAHNLPRECVPTQWLKEALVWEALLEKMPMTAMIRNLATMTRCGLIGPLTPAVKKICGELGNQERLKKARIHPIACLTALLTYRAGVSPRGGETWNPESQICDALDAAFYLAFGNVEPTGKNHLLALDVSGSMGGGCVAGVIGLTPRIASAAMALVIAATEPAYKTVAFTTTLLELDISPKQRLDDVVRKISGLPFGGTDCAQPMLWAAERKVPVDMFVTITDGESWAGQIHPCQALEAYRRAMGRPAKQSYIAMTGTGQTLVDPGDAGVLNFSGFDTAVPALLADFARG